MSKKKPRRRNTLVAEGRGISRRRFIATAGIGAAGAAAEAASRGADPLEQNGYKLALVRAIVEESLLELV